MTVKKRWGLKRLMGIVAIAGIVVWAGLNWSPWPDSLRDWRIHRLLDRTIRLHHPEGVPLDQLLAEIKAQTRDLSSPSGLTIYLDPNDLQDAGQDIHSPVKIDANEVPLGPALRSALEPLGLTYHVFGGMIVIAKPEG